MSTLPGPEQQTPKRWPPTTLSAQVIADARAQLVVDTPPSGEALRMGMSGGGGSSTSKSARHLEALRCSIALTQQPFSAPTGVALTPLSALGAQSKRRRQLMADVGEALESLARQLHVGAPDPPREGAEPQPQLQPPPLSARSSQTPISARSRGDDEVNIFLSSALQQLRDISSRRSAHEPSGPGSNGEGEGAAASGREGSGVGGGGGVVYDERLEEATARGDQLQEQLAEAERELDAMHDRAASLKAQALAAERRASNLQEELTLKDRELDDVRAEEAGNQATPPWSDKVLERAVELAMAEGWEQAQEEAAARLEQLETALRWVTCGVS
jgi:hypothetical protein